MLRMIFSQSMRLLLKMKIDTLPSVKNFHNCQKFPRTMSARPRLFPCLHHHPPPPTTTTTTENSMSAISQLFLTRFDQTLKIGSLDHLEQIPSVIVTFVHATFVHVTFVHIRNISAVTALILTRF